MRVWWAATCRLQPPGRRALRMEVFPSFTLPSASHWPSPMCRAASRADPDRPGGTLPSSAIPSDPAGPCRRPVCRPAGSPQSLFSGLASLFKPFFPLSYLPCQVSLLHIDPVLLTLYMDSSVLLLHLQLKLSGFKGNHLCPIGQTPLQI